MDCPQCNTEVPRGQRFCTRCGAPLSDDAARPTNPTPPVHGPSGRGGAVTMVLPWVAGVLVGILLSIVFEDVSLSPVALPSLVLNALLLGLTLSALRGRRVLALLGVQLGAWLLFVVLRSVIQAVWPPEDPGMAIWTTLVLPALFPMAMAVWFIIIMKRAATLPPRPPEPPEGDA